MRSLVYYPSVLMHFYVWDSKIFVIIAGVFNMNTMYFDLTRRPSTSCSTSVSRRWRKTITSVSQTPCSWVKLDVPILYLVTYPVYLVESSPLISGQQVVVNNVKVLDNKFKLTLSKGWYMWRFDPSRDLDFVQAPISMFQYLLQSQFISCCQIECWSNDYYIPCQSL